MPRYRVIIPTYQAEAHLSGLIPALAAQGLDPADILVIDSSSTDSTVARFREFGAKIKLIKQADFNHGGTRRFAVGLCADAPFLILITQDAIPAPGAFDRLIEVFENQRVAMAYGRQLPRECSRAIERHARLRNYPSASSEVRQFEDRERYGMKAVFSSNSFAAYRTAALMEIGNFPKDAFFGEDQISAGRFLVRGWHVAYVSDAEAVHSHEHRIRDDFRRYFDIGVFHSRNRWLIDTFGKAEGEGLRFLKSEMSYLLEHEPKALPGAMLRTLLKYVGYRLGLLEKHLSLPLKKVLSSAPYYWSSIQSRNDRHLHGREANMNRGNNKLLNEAGPRTFDGDGRTQRRQGQAAVQAQRHGAAGRRPEGR